MDRWSRLSEPGRKFVVLSAAAVLGGLLVGPLMSEPLPSMAAAAVSAALVVAVLWLSEGAGVPAAAASGVAFAAGATASLSLAAWGGETVAWLATLGLLSVACRPRDSASSGETPEGVETDEAPPLSAELPPAELPLEPDDDPDATQVRRRFDGGESVGGVARCTPGPNHIVFHPPLAAAPEAEAYGLDDGCEASVAAATRHGLRLTVRGAGRVAYEASASDGSSISSSTGP